MTKTMTAEEVEKSRQTLSRRLHKHLGDYDRSEQEALSRLAAQAAQAAQAARVPGLEAQVDEMQRRALGAEAERSDLAAKHLSALSERDAAQAEVSRLTGRVTSDARDMGRLRQKASDLAQDVSGLRERVATLEREVKAQDDARLWTESDLTTAGISVDDGLHDAVHALIQARDTAVARAKELASAITVEIGKCCGKVLPHGCGVCVRLSSALHSQPPPAWTQQEIAATQPAPALAQGVDIESMETAASPEVLASFARLKRDWVSPTPPPGLREAVGKFLALRGVVKSPNSREWLGAMRDLAAAYDATGGRHVKTMAECSDAQGRAARDEAIAEDMEDAAKYRAAVERLEECRQMGGRWTSGHAAAEWVLYGNDAPPAPRETLDKARVVEVLNAKRDAAEDVASVSEDADSDTHAQQVDLIRETVESIAEDLGITLDTPPSGPGGGETKCDTCHGSGRGDCLGTEVECGRCQGTGEDCLEDDAPTPTPEVPPQPSIPSVVWEGEEEHGRRTQLFADGRIEPAWDNPSSCVNAMFQLARALAEAKREVQTAKERALADMAERLGYSPREGMTADDLFMSIWQYVDNEEENAANRAAESMRERAAKVLDALGGLSQVAEIIRAIPLEAP